MEAIAENTTEYENCRAASCGAKPSIEKAIDLIRTTGRWMTPHELSVWITDTSESALGRRMRTATNLGRLVSRVRDGKRYKEWGLPEWGAHVVRNPNGGFTEIPAQR